MTVISKYKAKDGCEFKVEGECLAYEQLLDAVESAMLWAPKCDPEQDCNFANGDGYLQWGKEKYADALANLKRLAEAEGFVKGGVQFGSGGMMRTMQERGSPLYGPIFKLLYCTDPIILRQYGQHYYLLNPSKAKQVCMNV